MHKEQLQNARDYFDNVTTVAYQQFMQSEVTIAVVYSMAASLFHLAEWVYVHDRAKVQAKHRTEIRYGGELWDRVVMRNIPEADLIRDLTNTAKRIKLSFYATKPRAGAPSAGTHLAAYTFISTSPIPAHGGPPAIELEKSGTDTPLEPVATAVFEFWRALIEELYPKAAVKVAPSPIRSRARPQVETALPPKMRF